MPAVAGILLTKPPGAGSTWRVYISVAGPHAVRTREVLFCPSGIRGAAPTAFGLPRSFPASRAGEELPRPDCPVWPWVALQRCPSLLPSN